MIFTSDRINYCDMVTERDIEVLEMIAMERYRKIGEAVVDGCIIDEHGGIVIKE